MKRYDTERVEIRNVPYRGNDEFVIIFRNRSEMPVKLFNPTFKAYGIQSDLETNFDLKKTVLPNHIDSAYARFPGIDREYIAPKRCKLIDTGYSRKT